MNDALINFQKTVCPDIPLNETERLTERLISEIGKLRSEVEGSGG